MSINYKHKTHKKNVITGNSLCGKDDVEFSDNPECKTCINIDKRHQKRILEENEFKRGMK